MRSQDSFDINLCRTQGVEAENLKNSNDMLVTLLEVAVSDLSFFQNG